MAIKSIVFQKYIQLRFIGNENGDCIWFTTYRETSASQRPHIDEY
jgi:hypothetical protein